MPVARTTQVDTKPSCWQVISPWVGLSTQMYTWCVNGTHTSALPLIFRDLSKCVSPGALLAPGRCWPRCWINSSSSWWLTFSQKVKVGYTLGACFVPFLVQVDVIFGFRLDKTDARSRIIWVGAAPITGLLDNPRLMQSVQQVVDHGRITKMPFSIPVTTPTIRVFNNLDRRVLTIVFVTCC